MDKENIELAEEHIKLAEEIVSKEARDAEGSEQKKLMGAELSLEKAEANLEESD